jgi:cell division protein FtsB
MSAVIRARRSKRRPASTTALWLVLGLAVSFFIVRYGQEVLMEHDLNGRAAAQRVTNALLREENARLKASLEYYRSDKYIEQRAREGLNLRRGDEEVLIPVIASHEPAADAAGIERAEAGSAPAKGPAPERANWQKWLDLFVQAP